MSEHRWIIIRSTVECKCGWVSGTFGRLNNGSYTQGYNGTAEEMLAEHIAQEHHKTEEKISE